MSENTTKRDKKIEKKVKKFMKAVRAFLAHKAGYVADEWECSLILLEEYYKQFLVLTDEINNLESLVSLTRYGEAPNALLVARDKTAVRLEALLKTTGCTFKEATKLEVIEPVVEESPLDTFMKNKIEKR